MEIYKMVFSPIQVNTYILEDESGDCAIIDCGCYDDTEFSRLVSFIEKKKINPVLLLNTHCHLDHIFGNGFMLKKYGLRTHSGELDEINRKNAVQHALMFGLNMDPPPEPEAFIRHDQVLSFGSTELVALHVPGHAPGGLAFYSKKNGVVFTGDALFAGSIGRSDLPGGDHEQLLESIKENLFVLPSETVVYSGHGEDTTIGNEIRTNPFFL